MAPKQYSQQGFKDKAWLYGFVFWGRTSLFVTLVLLVAFLIQPINQAMAEGHDEAAPIAEDVVPQSEPDSTEPEAVDEEPATVVEASEEDSLDLGDSTNDEEVAEEEVLQEDEENTPEPIDDEVVVDEEEAPTPVLTDPEDDAPKTLEEIQEEVQAELDEREDNVRELEYLVTDQNFFQFDRQSCIAVGNGSYHCTVNDAPTIDESTAVYADKGSNGAQQIFLRTSSGSTKQLTNDSFDNTSPHYDAETRQIVWQRQIDGRYQIVLYQIDEDEERQLTFSRTNNMEPKVSEDGIVWQAWDGNDWEIMYFDGTYTDQLTDNDLQDVAPAVEDRYVLWSVLGTETNEVKVYSLDGKETLTITGQEGGTIANPRFVLVYDTRFENGDIITQGFNPLTGESAPLGATPASEPIDIPDVDPLGEVRALINSKAQQEDDLKSALNPDGDAGNTDTIQLNKASTTETTLDLSADISVDDEVVIMPNSEPENDFELTDFDLIITPKELPKEIESKDTLTLSSTQ